METIEMATKQTDSLPEKKSPLIAYLMWGLGFVGIGGMHRFYLGQNNVGLALLVTFGGCGIGQILDVSTLGDSIKIANGERAKTEKNTGKAMQSREERISPMEQVKEHKKDAEPKEVDEFDALMADQAELEKRLKGFKE